MSKYTETLSRFLDLFEVPDTTLADWLGVPVWQGAGDHDKGAALIAKWRDGTAFPRPENIYRLFQMARKFRPNRLGKPAPDPDKLKVYTEFMSMTAAPFWQVHPESLPGHAVNVASYATEEWFRYLRLNMSGLTLEQQCDLLDEMRDILGKRIASIKAGFVLLPYEPAEGG